MLVLGKFDIGDKIAWDFVEIVSKAELIKIIKTISCIIFNLFLLNSNYLISNNNFNQLININFVNNNNLELKLVC